MKKILVFLLFLVVFPFFLPAQTAEDKRRIDEEKRQSLRPSEAGSGQRVETGYPPSSSINIDYFSELVSRKTAFNSDACRALILFSGKQAQYKDFDSQVRFLKTKQIIPQEAISDFAPDDPLRKGIIAYMFCRVLDIKGGLWVRLFGLTQRYAVRELVFEGLMASGSVKEIISGKELVLILIQAAEYMTIKAAGKSAKISHEGYKEKTQ